MQATLERLRERREQRGDEGGFTLIELLIVIVILGILAAIVVFAVQNLTSQSAKASCGSDYKTVETAFETYKAQVGHYPAVGSASSTGDNWAPSPGGTQTPGAKPSLFGDGVEAMFATQTGVDGSSVGPWLKDAPTNGSLYRIWVAETTTAASGATDGTADAILVENLSTQKLPANGATATVSGGTITNTATGTNPPNYVATATTAGVNGSCSDAGL